MLKVILFVILDTLFTIFVCLFVNWWAPLFANDKGWLPNWLSWVQTFDDTLDAGSRDGVFTTNSVFLARVFWLYRNPGYGFSYWALGVPFNASEWTVETYNTDPLHFLAKGPNGQFNLHIIKFGFRFKLGWKAWNMYNKTNGEWLTTPWGPEMRIPFTLSISKA